MRGGRPTRDALSRVREADEQVRGALAEATVAHAGDDRRRGRERVTRRSLRPWPPPTTMPLPRRGPLGRVEALPIAHPAPGALSVLMAVGRLDLMPVVPSDQATPLSCHKTVLPGSKMSVESGGA